MRPTKSCGWPRNCGIAFANGYARIIRLWSPDTSRPATPAGGPGRNADLLVDPLVGPEPVGIDPALRGGPPHGASRLGQVATIVEAAFVEVGAELGKGGPQRVGTDPPRPHFAHPWRIDNVRIRAQRHELGGRGGMAPGAPPGADLGRAQPQAGGERGQQARLPGTRG